MKMILNGKLGPAGFSIQIICFVMMLTNIVINGLGIPWSRIELEYLTVGANSDDQKELM